MQISEILRDSNYKLNQFEKALKNGEQTRRRSLNHSHLDNEYTRFAS